MTTGLTATPAAELAAHGIVKRYAGVPALGGVSVAVSPGQVLGLVGHNGAGKSTLLKCLSGAVRPDEGTVAIGGRPVSFGEPADAIAAGVSTVYQELSLLPNLSVTQNVFLGRELTRAGALAQSRMRREARAAVARFELDVDVDRPTGQYPVATRQLLEIAVAVHRDARFLLLDEPTTSLEGEQIERLLAMVRELARKDGLGVLLVDHKLDELYEVADTVVALVDGLVRVAGPAAEVPRDEIVRAIAGDAAAQLLAEIPEVADDAETGVAAGETDAAEPVAPMASSPADGTDDRGEPDGAARAPSSAASQADGGTPAVRIRRLRTATLRGVDLDAYPGRVLGLYGLVGAGRTELLRALVGLDPITGGTIEVNGRPLAPKDPAHAQRHGLVYVTEERKIDGIVPELDATLNVTLPIVREFAHAGWLNRRAMRARAAALMDEFKVLGDRDAPVVSLSGGNQQKILLARALGQQPSVLLLDEPTKGVDIGVKVEIHRMIRALVREQGLTVILVSSEDDEILEVCDEVAIVAAGTCDGRRVPTAGLTVAELRRAAWAAA